MVKKPLLLLAVLLTALSSPAHGAGNSIYANMEKGPDGRYQITEITNKESKLDLKDLAPVGYNTQKWDCSHAFWGKYRVSPKECAPADIEFRTSEKKLLPTLLLGVMTGGITLVLGVVKEESVFDKNAFDKAVSEALAVSGLDVTRDAIIGQYQLIREMANKYNLEINGFFRQYTDEYYSKSPKRAINKQIIDRSGYYREDDLLKDVIIKISLRHMAPMEHDKYSIEEFSVPPSEIEGKLDALKKEMKETFARNKAEYHRRLRQEISVFDVVCGPEVMSPYHIRYECPKTVPIESADVPEATAIVVSKDFRNIFPLYAEEDEFLRVTLASNTITIENRSGKDVQIKSASMVYNGKKSVVYTGEDSRSGIKPLAPNAASQSIVPFKRLMNNDIAKEAEFREMTREKAKKIAINFAIEIRYKVGEEGAERTLFQKKEFRLEDLIG